MVGEIEDMTNQTVYYFSSIIRGSKQLNKREKEILLRRLTKRTLIKIGRKNKVSGERIRQIEKNALQKLIRKVGQLLLFE